MKQIVIEYNVRGLDGTVYPSVGMTAEEYGQEIFDELAGFLPDQPDQRLIEQCEGLHGDNACTYDVAFIQTNADIEGWIDVLDSRTKNKI